MCVSSRNKHQMEDTKKILTKLPSISDAAGLVSALDVSLVALADDACFSADLKLHKQINNQFDMMRRKGK